MTYIMYSRAVFPASRIRSVSAALRQTFRKGDRHMVGTYYPVLCDGQTSIAALLNRT